MYSRGYYRGSFDQRRGVGRGRGRGRGRGWGRGASRLVLDNELDQYMASTD